MTSKTGSATIRLKIGPRKPKVVGAIKTRMHVRPIRGVRLLKEPCRHTRSEQTHLTPVCRQAARKNATLPAT